MPPSQLKRLKASLREQGITGPPQSKKQKKAKDGKHSSERIQRNVALQQIRNSFNPFEIKAPSRPAKFQHATPNGSAKKVSFKDVLHRPGVTKSAGEEMRRATLLPELQRRNKVGALIDRRIGEGDPGMTTEERAVERFAQEKSRGRGANVFDLEASDDDEPKISLTHGGRRLDELPADDFEALSGGDGSDPDEEFLQRKRARQLIEAAEGENDEDDQPEKKKTKKEVMQEVIAKSKAYKYERQKTKEDDDDLREQLDGGMSDLLSLLRGNLVAATKAPLPQTSSANGNGPSMNPDRQKLLDGMDRSQVDKEYDARLKQLAQDTRAQPSERTKTEEEKATEGAARLRDLEERRVKRMRGEEVSEDEDEYQATTEQTNGDVDDEDEILDEAAEFGFTTSDTKPGKENKQLVLDDEDEFALDEDLIASGSEIDVSDVSASDDDSTTSTAEEDAGEIDDDEDEFVKGILGDHVDVTSTSQNDTSTVNGTNLAFTYPCPRAHSDLLDVLKDSPADHLPTIIQRIRALHHPSLSAGNKEAMADFSSVLVDHLSYMGSQKQSLIVTEQVIRHLHSLSRTYVEDISNAFRRHLGEMHEKKSLDGGDLVVLTAIGTIYPTSDHFHQVVTPAMTLMARWLGLNTPDSESKSSIGAFLVALCIKYQRLSKRFIPEGLRFTFIALSDKQRNDKNHLANLIALAELWRDHSSFTELFSPFLPHLQQTSTSRAHQTLTILLGIARQRRRPLELHHHRPKAIRTSIPKFEEGYHPDKHYDPDRERAASARLRAEHKRERKGALRELRKDANFLARAQLREKRARDEEYEKKYRRLVAEVQGEEGREKKAYEREKVARKRESKKN